MTRFPLDDDTTDRLLAGLVAPDDAPAGFAHVAALVRAARGPATEEELAAVPFDVPTARAASVVAAGGFSSPDERRRRGRTLVRVGVVAAVVGLGATAAAASQGVLPDPVQRAVSRVADRVGWSLPTPDGGGSTGTGGSGTTAAPGIGPGGSGRPEGGAQSSGVPSGGTSGETTALPVELRGLCVAFLTASDRALERAPFDALASAFGVAPSQEGAELMVVAGCAPFAPATSAPDVAPSSRPADPTPGSSPTAPTGNPDTTNHGSGPPASKPGNPTPGVPPTAPPGKPTTTVGPSPASSTTVDPVPGTGAGNGNAGGNGNGNAGGNGNGNGPPSSTPGNGNGNGPPSSTPGNGTGKGKP